VQFPQRIKLSKYLLHNPNLQYQMQRTGNIKKNMQQQYAFFIPIARIAANFSKDDTASDRQDDRKGFLPPITRHIHMFCEEGSSFVVRKV